MSRKFASMPVPCSVCGKLEDPLNPLVLVEHRGWAQLRRPSRQGGLNSLKFMERIEGSILCPDCVARRKRGLDDGQESML